MTKEEKELLLKDLCARLPYGNTEVKVTEPTNDIMDEVFVGKHICSTIDIEDFILGRFIIRPYLRPMSSMTEKECKELGDLPATIENVGETLPNSPYYIEVARHEQFDWLNSHHFDYRGLIEKGLAIEAPKDMYEIQD